MSVYLVGAIEVHDPDEYARYRDGVGAALAPFEGVAIVSADDHPEIIEGAAPANHLFIVRFRSLKQLHAFYASDAYQRIIGFRHKSSHARFLMAMRGPDHQEGN